jgi:hypothetical protein
MSIPANETALGLLGFSNGTLFNQLNQSFESYLTNDNGNSINLTVLPDDLASLTFYAADNGTQWALSLSEAIFDPIASRVPVPCIYPLSGQYDTLSRALFYVLLVFSLVLRRHVWISVAALGTAMTYAAVSAVHLFALATNYGFAGSETGDKNSSKDYADIDIFATFPILSAAAIMLSPILMWSTSVRKHHAQAVIIYWGILIFSALVVNMALLYSSTSNLNVLFSFAVCTDTSDQCLSLQPPLTLQLYSDCKCFDFCGTLSPDAPMRRLANMVPLLYTSVSDDAILSTKFNAIYSIAFYALTFIIVNGGFGILESQFTQEEVRNAIFRVLNADARMWIKVIFEGEREDKLLEQFHLRNPDTRPTMWKKCRYVFAKGVATIFSLSAMLLILLAPLLLLATIILNEIVLQAFPASEHSDAVGAWSTWVGAALVLIASVIDRYHEAWMESLIIIIHAAWRVIKYAKGDRPHFRSENIQLSVRLRIKLFLLEIASPFIHGWDSTRRAFWTLKTTLKFFVAWWKDTETMSRQVGADITNALVAEKTKSPGGIPKCRCRICKHSPIKQSAEEQADEIPHSGLRRFRKKVKRRLGNEYKGIGSASSTMPLQATEQFPLAGLPPRPESLNSDDEADPVPGAAAGTTEEMDSPYVPSDTPRLSVDVGRSDLGLGLDLQALEELEESTLPHTPSPPAPVVPTPQHMLPTQNSDQSPSRILRKPVHGSVAPTPVLAEDEAALLRTESPSQSYETETTNSNSNNGME